MDDEEEVAAATAVVCLYKGCKKTPKDTADGATFAACSVANCGRHIHRACGLRMLEAFGASEDFNQLVCRKRCYNAAVKQASQPPPSSKKRIRWDDDGPSPSLSSISCLIDWLTTGANYSRYRGGDAQNGSSKATIASEILKFIADAGVTTVRTPGNVMDKIRALEEAYRRASDWLGATGSGVVDKRDLRQCVLDRCEYYYELHDVMEDRHSIHPLMTNTDPRFEIDDDEPEESTEQENGDSDGDDQSRGQGPADTTDTTQQRPASTPLSIGSTSNRRKVQVEPHPDFVKLKEVQAAEDINLKRKTLECRQDEVQLQRELIALKKKRAEVESKESELRIQELSARTHKLEREAEHWRVQTSVNLLRERARLRQENIPQDEIDRLLPLPP